MGLVETPTSETQILFGTVWITGLSASGKTSLGEALKLGLEEHGYPCILLDGEAIRQQLSRCYGHAIEERIAVLREVVAIARSARDRGLIPIVATISHKRDMRTFAREVLGRMLEVYLDCPASVCAERDGKGHYCRAYAGEYECFVGVTEPYETSSEADLVVNTARSNVGEAAQLLLTASINFLGEPPAPLLPRWDATGR